MAAQFSPNQQSKICTYALQIATSLYYCTMIHVFECLFPGAQKPYTRTI